MASLEDNPIMMEYRKYDPYFTADISSKMRIPDRLAMREGGTSAVDEPLMKDRSPVHMSVPERILVAGGDTHVGLERAPPTVLDLDDSLPPPDDVVAMVTPPRVISLLEQNYPGVEDMAPPVKKYVDYSGAAAGDTLGAEDRAVPEGKEDLELYSPGRSPDNTICMEEDERDDVARLNKQVAKLSRKVRQLEASQETRAQRERVLYPALILYFLVKAGLWFIRRQD